MGKCSAKSFPKGQMMNVRADVGSAAGKLWQYLSKNGVSSLEDLSCQADIDCDLAKLAVGWLAREDKVCLSRDKNDTYIRLSDSEVRV
ncbi:MAG: winged helix-turn-helix domain-containing protein [Planctomycetes bacterium]|nr:winged helix-turn-helix domain-containing protein [Planctomycetota bacterium]